VEDGGLLTLLLALGSDGTLMFCLRITSRKCYDGGMRWPVG